jgi:hypothetical protein
MLFDTNRIAFKIGWAINMMYFNFSCIVIAVNAVISSNGLSGKLW